MRERQPVERQLRGKLGLRGQHADKVQLKKARHSCKVQIDVEEDNKQQQQHFVGRETERHGEETNNELQRNARNQKQIKAV